MTIETLTNLSKIDPSAIAEHYASFRVTQRILLTGHSHQAWPDTAFNGQQQAWQDAAEFVDSKWELAFQKAAKVKLYFSRQLADPAVNDVANNYALASNTHDLLLRFLSALDWKKGKQIITTDGEFHSMRRQLARLQEEGVDVICVPVLPSETLTERMKAEITDKTIGIMMSAVMFKNSSIIPHLKLIAEAADNKYIPFLVDAYHATNIVPFTIKENGLEQAFVLGGGYKYCQFGEGNCFIRIPPGCDSRPIITGWFAEFGDLDKNLDPAITKYPSGGDRFQGSTYDTTSHYRACSVIDFFDSQDLTIERLRALSQHQIGLLRSSFDDLDCNPKRITRADVKLDQIAGFLSLKTSEAPRIQKALQEVDVWTDQRDGYLRFGPAPYLSDKQITDAILALGEIL
jgi:kynureninase